MINYLEGTAVLVMTLLLSKCLGQQMPISVQEVGDNVNPF